MAEPQIVYQMAQIKHIYTVEEAMEFLQVTHPDTIYSVIKAGRLLAVKVGQGWRIPGGALLMYAYGAKLSEQKAISGDVIAALEGSLGKKAA